jgi:hypothetical protein
MNENRSFSQTAIPLTISVLGLAALLYVLRDMVRIVLDPGVSVVTADELLSGAPVTHPRIIIEGACVHLDSAATGDWTTRGKGGTNRHSETVAPLRHAQTGQPLGWLLRDDDGEVVGLLVEHGDSFRGCGFIIAVVNAATLRKKYSR